MIDRAGVVAIDGNTHTVPDRKICSNTMTNSRFMLIPIRKKTICACFLIFKIANDRIGPPIHTIMVNTMPIIVIDDIIY